MAGLTAAPYDVRPLDAHPDGLPLLITPRDDRDPDHLATWLRADAERVAAELTRAGAILFRGFAAEDAPAFERVARAIDDDLGQEYLGTSPRRALTSHVFTASELPPFYPIPAHCEMSFTADPPRRLFFCCLVEPAAGSGETPVADVRRVLADLDPAVRRRFEERGLRIVRNYGATTTRRFDPWQLKPWTAMFGTDDRAVVEAKCRAEGFTPTWLPGGGLRLVSTQPVVRTHPATGEPAWHNHATTFHVSQAAGEYARIFRLRPTVRHWLVWQLARVLERLQRARPADARAMHCTHLDGGEIADADIEAVREAFWRHLVVFPWCRGDVLAIDNRAVAHGRLPYVGPREIAVCWA